MARLALLLKANSNRVFGDAAFALGAAELALLDEHVLPGLVRASERRQIAGVDYLVVDTHRSVDPADLAVLSNLSSLHAAFEIDEQERFLPLAITPRAVLDDDLLTIQRYAGKTNEAFTHLLVNAALAASDGTTARLLAGERVRLLDPVCGRGTTLNRAAAYGMDAVGIDADQRDVEEYAAFLLTWLKDKRLKHKVDKATLRKGRDTPAHRLTVTYGTGKDVTTHRVIDVVHDDTRRARDHLRPRSVDLIAADLPYGVQHGAQSGPGRLDRGPAALLEEALPVWRDLLRPGGAAALAWNRRTLPRGLLVDLARGAGFAVERKDDDSFAHRVDRSITRDVLVAVRSPDG
jgi:SAM-dependent methyltransferase